MDSRTNEEGTLEEKARCKQLRDRSSFWVHVSLVHHVNTPKPLLIHAKQASFLILSKSGGELKGNEVDLYLPFGSSMAS